ncbi:MAG: hypothetical protein RJQ14_12725 [Marinoscillum sp.]
MTKILSIDSMTEQPSPGLIWFHDIFHCGNQDDYDAFCQLYADAKLVMSYYASSPQELQNIANSLNNSNILTSTKS